MKKYLTAVMIFGLGAWLAAAADEELMTSPEQQLEILDENIKGQESALAELKQQGVETETVTRAEQNLNINRMLRDRLVQEMQQDRRDWSAGPSDTGTQPLDAAAARRLLQQREESRARGAGDDGGYYYGQPDAGAADGRAETESRAAHRLRPGDHEFRREGAASTGPVTDPFAAASMTVSQVNSTVHGIRQIKEEVEHIDEP